MPGAVNGSRPPAAEVPDNEASLQELWSSISRGRWLVLGVTAVVIAFTGLGSVLVRPVYESEAVLRIKSDDPGGGFLSELAPLKSLGLGSLGQDEVDTERGVLRSRRMAALVIDSLGLTVRPLDRAVRRDTVLRVLHTGRDTLSGRFILRHQGDGAYSLSTPFWRTHPAGVPRIVRVGEPFEIGATRLVLDPASGVPPRELSFRLTGYEKTMKKMRKTLRVDAQDGGSKLVEVSYRDSDPVLAAAVVNGIVDHYMAYKARTDKSESRHTIEVLREQTAEQEELLRRTEAQLRSYQELQRIVAPEEQATQQVRRIAEIQARRDALAVERAALSDLLGQVGSRPLRSGEESPYRQLATFPSFITNGAVQDLLQTLLELENTRSELLARRTPENHDVRVINGRIAELEAQLFGLARNYRESLQTQIASADVALAGFGRELESIPSREIEYARLQRERKLQSEIYLVLQGRLKEAEVQDAIDPGDVRVIDYGVVPHEPVFPKPLVNVLLASILGLMMGASAAIGRDMVSTKIRSRADAERAASGLPVLGAIPPLLPAVGPSEQGRRGIRVRVPAIVRRTPVLPGVETLITRTDPWNAGSEAYRALLANLSRLPGERPRVILITSAHGGDGKSTVAANLAVTMAQIGARALLMDADLRHPRQHSLFGLAQAPGFADLLSRSSTFDEVVRELESESAGVPLHVMTAGTRPGNPGALLQSERVAELLSAARTRYDYVLLDAPALDLAADALLVGAAADTALLVARSGATERSALEQAAVSLRRVGISVAGLVLNDVAATVIREPAGREPQAERIG